MSAGVELPLTLERDRTAGMSATAGYDAANHPRAVDIHIAEDNGKFKVELTPHDYAHLFPVTTARIPLTPSELWRVTSDCTRVWRDRVVNYWNPLLPQKFSFHERSRGPLNWMGHTLPLVYSGILKDLARAGRKLFQQIFRPPADGYEEMCEIGAGLEKLVDIPDLWVRITTEDFYAPWNLMYLGDFRRNPSSEKFWGFQHLIEHDPAKRVMPPRVFGPKLDVALHFDAGIDRQFPDIACNARVQSLLGGYETIGISQRHTKDEFLEKLGGGADEELFYFCCHATAGGDAAPSFGNPRLMLTDLRPTEQQEQNPSGRDFIEPDDIDVYLDNRKWPARPIVFMNCCEVAKMSSIFYRGFASKFLNHHASAVIGPNIEIPAVFARDFATQFFDRFFEGGTDRSIGSVLHELRREFLRDHDNPLGLVYLLYRGADTYLTGPILKRAAP